MNGNSLGFSSEITFTAKRDVTPFTYRDERIEYMAGPWVIRWFVFGTECSQRSISAHMSVRTNRFLEGKL